MKPKFSFQPTLSDVRYFNLLDQMNFNQNKPIHRFIRSWRDKRNLSFTQKEFYKYVLAHPRKIPFFKYSVVLIAGICGWYWRLLEIQEEDLSVQTARPGSDITTKSVKIDFLRIWCLRLEDGIILFIWEFVYWILICYY